MAGARRFPTSEREPLTVVMDFPERLSVTEAELALIETYLRDIVQEMLNAGERGSGHATAKSAS
ncbi:hypothetical protein [Roseibium sp.]|uniref:hypothetical protein n=1 Tax=Roseibium sp. TaxID=1936156 RepID=UPI003298D085